MLLKSFDQKVSYSSKIVIMDQEPTTKNKNLIISNEINANQFDHII